MVPAVAAPPAPPPPAIAPAGARAFAEALPLIVWTANRDGRIDSVNGRWLEACGLGYDEAVAAGWPGLLLDGDADRAAAWWSAAVAGGTIRVAGTGTTVTVAAAPIELRLRRARDGAIRRHELRAQPLHDDAGHLVGWIGSATDVEEQRAAADESRRLARVIEAQTRVYAAGLDLERVLDLVADEILALTPAEGAIIARRDGDEVLLRAGRGMSACLEGSRLPLGGSLAGKSLRQRELVRTGDTRRDGHAHQPTAARAGARSLVIVPLVDRDQADFALIVSSTQPDAFGELDVYALQLLASGLSTAVANAARAATELRFRTLLDTMAEGVWQLDAQARTTFVNSHMARMLGYSADEMMGRSLLDFVDPESRAEAELHLARRRRGESSTYDLKLRCKDGDAVWVAKSGAPLFDERGRVIGALGALTNVTRRRELEQQVRAQNQTYAAVLAAQGQVGLGFAIADVETRRFVHVSDTLARIYGYRPDELLALDSYMALVPPEDLERMRARVAGRASATAQDIYETVHLRRDGRRIHIELARLPMDERHVVVLVRNIDERIAAQAEVAASARRLELMLSHVESAVLLADAERVRFVNRAFEELMGIGAGEIVGLCRADATERVLRNFDDPSQFLAHTTRDRHDPLDLDARLDMQRPRRCTLRWRARAVELAGGLGQFVSFTDITAEADLAREREQQAHTDPLTGLYNRRGGEQALSQARARARHDGRAVSLLLADIDHFKRVNDTFGHDVGDRVIAQVARALAQSVRGGDVVARWGGEELLIVLPRAGAPEARLVAERCRAAVAACAVAEAPALALSISIGISELGAGEDLAPALQRADAALYRAKHEGRNRVCG